MLKFLASVVAGYIITSFLFPNNIGWAAEKKEPPVKRDTSMDIHQTIGRDIPKQYKQDCYCVNGKYTGSNCSVSGKDCATVMKDLDKMIALQKKLDLHKSQCVCRNFIYEGPLCPEFGQSCNMIQKWGPHTMKPRVTEPLINPLIKSQRMTMV